MANIYPDQQRTIDPYAEYNSNATNRLTKVSTLGLNCILIPTYLDITIDSTNEVTISVGKCIVDDVLIDITSSFNVDFRESDFYLSASPFNEAGIYYLTLYYQYVKSKPAPRSYIKIFKHSEHALWTENYLFLKAIKVEFTGTRMIITDAYDSDPANYNRRRRYLPRYIDIVSGLPTWDSGDKGRTIYDIDTNIFYIGDASGWRSTSPLIDVKDTNSCDLYALGYLDSTNSRISMAIASDSHKLAQCVVIQKGDSNTGKIILHGVVDNVLVQTGINISFGDRLYLSLIEAGRITNVQPTSSLYPEGDNFAQFVGYAVEDGTSDVKIWFIPDTNWLNTIDLVSSVQYKVKVSIDDVDPKYLDDAIIVGSGLTKVVVDPGGTEKVSLSSDGKTSVSSNDSTPGYLQNKITAGSGILLAVLNEGGNEILRISSTGSGGGGISSGNIVVGGIIPYAANGTPSGYLLCDGTLYDTTAYSDLYDVIGDAYNSPGDPEGQFRVPDLRGKVIVGLDSGDPDINDLNESQFGFIDSTNGEVPYATMAMNYIIRYEDSGLAAADEMVKVDATDAATGYLDDKFDVGDGLVKETVDTGGGDKQIVISLGTSDSGSMVYRVYDFEHEITTETGKWFSPPMPSTALRDSRRTGVAMFPTTGINNTIRAAAYEYPVTFSITPSEDLIVMTDWDKNIFKYSIYSYAPTTLASTLHPKTEDLLATVNYKTWSDFYYTSTWFSKTWYGTAEDWLYYPITSIKPVVFDGYSNIEGAYKNTIYIPYTAQGAPNYAPSIAQGWPGAIIIAQDLAVHYIPCFGKNDDDRYMACSRDGIWTTADQSIYPTWGMGVYPAPTIEKDVLEKVHPFAVVLKSGITYTLKIRSIFERIYPTSSTTTYWSLMDPIDPSSQQVSGHCSSCDYTKIQALWNTYKNTGKTSTFRLYTIKKSSFLL